MPNGAKKQGFPFFLEYALNAEFVLVIVLAPAGQIRFDPAVRQDVAAVTLEQRQLDVNLFLALPIGRVRGVVSGADPEKLARRVVQHACSGILAMAIVRARLDDFLPVIPYFVCMLEQLVIEPRNGAALKVELRSLDNTILLKTCRVHCGRFTTFSLQSFEISLCQRSAVVATFKVNVVELFLCQLARADTWLANDVPDGAVRLASVEPFEQHVMARLSLDDQLPPVRAVRVLDVVGSRFVVENDSPVILFGDQVELAGEIEGPTAALRVGIVERCGDELLYSQHARHHVIPARVIAEKQGRALRAYQVLKAGRRSDRSKAALNGWMITRQQATS